jgi:hypothetical protein
MIAPTRGEVRQLDRKYNEKAMASGNPIFGVHHGYPIGSSVYVIRYTVGGYQFQVLRDKGEVRLVPSWAAYFPLADVPRVLEKVKPKKPVFGKPVDWDKMSSERKTEWALEMVGKANPKSRNTSATRRS